MIPESITGSRNFCVCYAGDGFEAGIACFQSGGSTYLAWKVDKTVEHAGGNNNSWDELLIELTTKNIDGARWLISQRPPLAQPKESILALVDAGIFPYITEIVETPYGKTINVFRDELSHHLPDEATLEFYGWQLRARNTDGYDIFVFAS